LIGQRHQDIKNGMTVAAGNGRWSKLLDFASKPSWVAGVLRGQAAAASATSSATSKAPRIFTKLSEMDGVRSSTLAELEGHSTGSRSIWPGKLILKGILERPRTPRKPPRPARRACRIPTMAAASSTGAPSSIEVLPEIVDTVGSKMEIMFDGGIRSGQDVMRRAPRSAQNPA